MDTKKMDDVIMVKQAALALADVLLVEGYAKVSLEVKLQGFTLESPAQACGKQVNAKNIIDMTNRFFIKWFDLGLKGQHGLITLSYTGEKQIGINSDVVIHLPILD